VQQGVREIVEGALAAVAPVAFTPGTVVVHAPRIDVVAVAAGTVERAILLPERMEIGMARIGVEELVEV